MWQSAYRQLFEQPRRLTVTVFPKETGCEPSFFSNVSVGLPSAFEKGTQASAKQADWSDVRKNGRQKDGLVAERGRTVFRTLFPSCTGTFGGSQLIFATYGTFVSETVYLCP